ncbi:hypothetical protein [Variovorax paradoxus]|uniref:hypothetical protein n=1 Tax=Variovorax paradoxus TaxID=34073 RepID=UPI00277E84EF|nr:hypothetical protein [Variovorax paradoxus]MDP9929214.1 hypothetical protein [Variovorax paradoxus]
MDDGNSRSARLEEQPMLKKADKFASRKDCNCDYKSIRRAKTGRTQIAFDVLTL